MSVTFGGLATGLDTNALIDELMKAERRPLERLEREKSYQTSRLDAFKSFETKLEGLLEKVEALDTAKEVRSYSATAATEEFFSLEGSSTVIPGSYQVEIKALAQVQKSVSQGYASKTDASFGTGTLTVNGQAIAYDGDSLSSLMDKINAANTGETPTGVSASIIHDGTNYRLVLSGDDSSVDFTATASETTAGAYAPPGFTTTQSAQQAHMVVDGIDIYSKTNVFKDAIPGVTLTAEKANDPGVKTGVSVDVDKEAIRGKVDDFIKAYNGIVNFIKDQSDADWGRDSAFRSAKRRIQDLLVTPVNGSGNLSTLSQLGIETQKDGTLTLEASTLEDLLATDLESVEKLFAGETAADGTKIEGVAAQFKSYLDGMTDSIDGLYSSRKKTTESNNRRIDLNIERMEVRLEQREKMLRAQFDAMETLVSSLNSQGNYLAQQITQWSNMS